MKILVVEDDENIRDLICLILARHFGYECRMAESVKIAKQILKEYWPDLILLDWVMPGNVVDIIEKTKQQRPIPRIVVVSASNRVKEYADAHGLEWLRKPFELFDLEQIVKTRGFVPQSQLPKDVQL